MTKHRNHKSLHVSGASAPANRLDPGSDPYGSMTEAEIRYQNKILQTRADVLARPLVNRKQEGQLLDTIQFKDGKEIYLIESRFVIELYACNSITRLPGLPRHVSGITNYRGNILVVFSLQNYLQPNEASDQAGSHILVLGQTQAALALLMNGEFEQLTLSIADIKNDGSEQFGKNRQWIRGITSEASILLDGGLLLSEKILHISQKSVD